VIVGEPTRDPPPPGDNVAYPRPSPNSGEPVYPPTERRLGHTGSVVLALCVDAEGNVTSASVKTSSGYPALDQSALDWAKRIRWRPGRIEGRPTAMCFDQPYRFVIRDE
ncbi:MAG: energy transducer TonB, partial [Gemmataceae bacterium]